MNNIILHKNKLYVSYAWLLNNGVSEGCLKNWANREVGLLLKVGNRAFIQYDSIPIATLSNIPSKEAIKAEYRANYHTEREQEITNLLKEAHSGKEFTRWIDQIRSLCPDSTHERVTEFARKASVINCILKIESTYNKKGDLERLFTAYNLLYPNAYSKKNRFCMALKKARIDGVLSIAVDKRAIVKRQPKYTELHQYWAHWVLSHNKGYSITRAYELFKEACIEEDYETPSERWFKGYYYENRSLIDRNALGESVWKNKGENYARIIPAEYAGDQWQIDGWRIPVYCKKPNDKGGYELFATYTIFAVMDAHSRRIIGYDIAESENTENILKGLERAVKETGILPYEIVADNHSFNKTKEAENLKSEMDKLGVTWTVDSNPKRKGILERSFRTLGDRHFKEQYGYIGQGVKSKVKRGITQQELQDIYKKPSQFLTFDQVACIAICMVDEYNNTLKKSLGDTPNNLYQKSEQPHAIKIDFFTRMTLFNRKTEHKVTNGQITIQRGAHKYEYQLPAEYSIKYNGKKVGVRYSDFDNIYLFDLDTDKGICSVPQKMAIHGALANQTDKDREYLNKNSGRIKGITSKGRKQKESLFDAANTINPNAYDTINRITTPKDIMEKIKQSYNLRSIVLDHGVQVETVSSIPVVDEMLDKSLKPPEKDIKHPFAVRGTEIKKISI